MSGFNGHVLVYGGRGALGTAVVDFLKSKNYWVASIDLNENTNANSNFVLKDTPSWLDQEKEVMTGVSQIVPPNTKLDAVYCVAGGWTGGNSASDSFIKACDTMWKQSVWSSALASHIAAKHLKPNGALVLMGAAGALSPTPGMLGYGVAKAAVHQLTRSLAAPKSGLPDGAFVAALLPATLDTEANRKAMPKADRASWTPLPFVAELLWKWTEARERPASGSLVQLHTSAGATELVLTP